MIINPQEDIEMGYYKIGTRSDFNKTGYGIYYNIDNDRISWISDIYDTEEEAEKEIVKLEDYRKSKGGC